MHRKSNDATNVKQLLDQIRESAAGTDRVMVRDILNGVGKRSFGPMVLLAGLVTIAPLIGDIPGVPTTLGMIVVLTLGQLLFRRHAIWLPSWISKRSVPQEKLLRGLDWLQKPARFFDRWTGPRLVFLVDGPGLYIMAIICMAVAMAMPLMEVVPFSANGGGFALMVFGIAMVARDGLLALVGIVISGVTVWAVISSLAGT